MQHSRCAGRWWWWASQHHTLLLASRRTDLLGTAHVRERHVRPDWVVVVNPRCMSCQALAHASLTSGGACSIVSIPACWACRSDRNLGRQQERAITLTMSHGGLFVRPNAIHFPETGRHLQRLVCPWILGATLARAWPVGGRELLDWPSTKRPRCASFYLHRSPSSATAATRFICTAPGSVAGWRCRKPKSRTPSYQPQSVQVDATRRLTSNHTCFSHRTAGIAGQHVLPCGCRLSGASWTPS